MNEFLRQHSIEHTENISKTLEKKDSIIILI